MDDKVNCKILKMSRPVTRGTPASKEEDKDEETVNTKKRPPAQEEENSPKKKWNQLKNTQKEDYLRGLLNEQFVWKGEFGRMTTVGYHIFER